MTRKGNGPAANDGTRERPGPTASDDGGTSGSDSDWTQVAQRSYEPDIDEELTTTIVFAIAAAMGVEPTDLGPPPLYGAVDASAIEYSLFVEEPGSGGRNGGGCVDFRYDGYRVEVRSDGWVRVYERSDGREP